MRPPRILLLMMTVALATSSGTAQVAGTERDSTARPNILFCIADDWGWPHASAYGDPSVKTPAFDRVAREGVLFTHAYVASPSCTPSRNAILTGQYHWRLDEGANLWSTLKPEYPVYPRLLEDSGYFIGRWRKAWGPGRIRVAGRRQDPVGPIFKKGFAAFMQKRPAGQPFCFWLGAWDPHRPYKAGSGKQAGIDIAGVRVPRFYPDVELVRSDIADYYVEVQRFDADVGKALELLEKSGELENTIVVVTGDHGMPFPRCKSNIYDMGVRVPLAIRWGKRVPGGRRIGDFVSLIDLAPTFCEISGLKAPAAMNGRSLVGMLTSGKDGRVESDRDHVIFGKERHVPCRPDHTGYPSRGIRTDRFAYIRNFSPDSWPVGDPPIFGDTDPAGGRGEGTTKGYLLAHRNDNEESRQFWQWSFGKRPAEELYDMIVDPDQLRNLAADPEYAVARKSLAARLNARLTATEDPRVVGGAEKFDGYPYYGGGAWKKSR